MARIQNKMQLSALEAKPEHRRCMTEVKVKPQREEESVLLQVAPKVQEAKTLES
jgi:hypothetical protein